MKEKKDIKAIVQKAMLDTDLLTYVATVIVILVMGLLDFSDFTNAKISYERLLEQDFWRMSVIRIVAYYILRFVYMKFGNNKEKENKEHAQADRDITDARKKIESTDRIEEFDIYAKDVVDVLDVLETYENLLSIKIIKYQTKSSLKKKAFLKRLLDERKELRDYRTAFMNHGDLSKQAFKISDLVIRGRVSVTSDVLFDGYSEMDATRTTGIVYDEAKDIRRKTNNGLLMSMLLTVMFTFFVNDIFLSTANFAEKAINFFVSILLAVVTIIMALFIGKAIALTSLYSKNKRLRYLNGFLATKNKTT